MSVVTDAIRLLDDEVAAFAFLPAINYFYLFWQNPDPSCIFTALSILAIFISALGYNVLVNVDFSSYGGEKVGVSENNNRLKGASYIIPIVSGIVWLGLLINSLLELYSSFNGPTIWPELLVAVTLLFTSLIFTDILLDLALPVYNDGSDQ